MHTAHLENVACNALLMLLLLAATERCLSSCLLIAFLWCLISSWRILFLPLIIAALVGSLHALLLPAQVEDRDSLRWRPAAWAVHLQVHCRSLLGTAPCTAPAKAPSGSHSHTQASTHCQCSNKPLASSTQSIISAGCCVHISPRRRRSRLSRDASASRCVLLSWRAAGPAPALQGCRHGWGVRQGLELAGQAMGQIIARCADSASCIECPRPTGQLGRGQRPCDGCRYQKQAGICSPNAPEIERTALQAGGLACDQLLVRLVLQQRRLHRLACKSAKERSLNMAGS